MSTGTNAVEISNISFPLLGILDTAAASAWEVSPIGERSIGRKKSRPCGRLSVRAPSELVFYLRKEFPSPIDKSDGESFVHHVAGIAAEYIFKYLPVGHGAMRVDRLD